MKHFLFLILLVCAYGCDRNSHGTPSSPGQKTVGIAADLYEQYVAEASQLQDDANDELSKATQELELADPEDRDAITERMAALLSKFQENHVPIVDKLIAIAESKDDPKTAFKAVEWVVTQMHTPYSKEEATRCILETYLDHKRVGDLVASMANGVCPDAATERLMEGVIEMSENEELIAGAMLTLSDYLSSNREVCKQIVDDPYFAKFNPGSMGYFRELSKTEDSRIENLMNDARAKYGKVKIGARTVSEILDAKIERAEFIKNLAVGKVAPDIEGPDIDGENFKLSDYRGKVVLLDFWGDW